MVSSSNTIPNIQLVVALLTAIWIVICVSSCKRPTDPELPPAGKDPRTYTWTIDTIMFPPGMQTIMQDVRGVSEEKVFVVGHNESTRGKMFQFDGSDWSPVELYFPDSSGAFQINLQGVTFAENEHAFAVGRRYYLSETPPNELRSKGLVIEYDGMSWHETQIPFTADLRSLWSSPSGEMWIVGYEGKILHRDTASWNLRSVRSDLNLKSIVGVGYSSTYILGDKLDLPPYDSVLAYLLKWNGAEWQLNDSTVFTEGESRFGVAGLWQAPNSKLYSAGPSIYSNHGAGWTKETYSGGLVVSVNGASSENVFAVGDAVHHFNGIDWFTFPRLLNSSVIYTGVWTNGKSVFVVGSDGFKTFVLYGK